MKELIYKWVKEMYGESEADNPSWNIGLLADYIERKSGRITGLPHEALCYFKDGEKWCCTFGDFINLQESPAGFGDTQQEALGDLVKIWNKQKGV